MSATDYFLGIDVGTTGTKALLLRSNGARAAEATSEYPLHTPRPLWSEQEPHDWWRATVASVRAVLEQARIAGPQVGAVGLTGQMHGLTLLDRRGGVLRPAILWNDQRTGSQCAAITQRVGAQRVQRLTGNPILPGFTAPKLAWVQEHEPDVFGRIDRVLLPKDYVRWRLTGEFASDVSDASGTALFEVGRRSWSDEMIAALDLRRSWLPEVTESPVVSARLASGAAAETGLPDGLPVVAGAGDQAAQAVGSGVVREGVVSATIGTSGVVFAASDTYRVEPDGRLHAFCHAVPGQWHLMGVMLAAGGAFRWYRDALGGGATYEQLTSEAAAAPAGCEGLLFLPYLCGERTPHPDPDARGVFFGLTLRHGRPHLTRAVLEGVSFGLRDSLELMRSLGIAPRQIRVSGGGAGSPLWRQIIADVFGVEIATLEVGQGAALGAAMLAAVGARAFTDVISAAERIARVAGTTLPGPAHGEYERTYVRYRALYPALKHEFARARERGA